MRQRRLMMGMPITVELVDPWATAADIDRVFGYFRQVDERFSPYKLTSEISRINAGQLQPNGCSPEMKRILAMAEQTKRETNGYFDIVGAKQIDPSGIVKGWAIDQASQMLRRAGFQNFYVDAGGDIAIAGKNARGELWRVGIRHPFQTDKLAKVLRLTDAGIATSGTYLRGLHIYNPRQRHQAVDEVVSLTVIGPNIYQADRLATAAFAMGRDGITFIERLTGFEGYQIDALGQATMTSGFESFMEQP